MRPGAQTQCGCLWGLLDGQGRIGRGWTFGADPGAAAHRDIVVATGGRRLAPLRSAARRPLSLSSDGQCLVVGDHDKNTDVGLVVWPAGYTVVLRDGDVTVLDETGAEAARVGDLITAVGGHGDTPANACGLSSAFHIQSRVK